MTNPIVPVIALYVLMAVATIVVMYRGDQPRYLKAKTITSLLFIALAVICFLISLLTVLTDTFGVTALSWIHTALPLDTFGFNWLIPTAIAAAIGHFLPGPEIEEK